MAFAVVRRVFLLRSATNALLSSQRSRFSTGRASTSVDDDDRRRSVTDRIQLSPLFQETGEDDGIGMKDCRIELIDDSTWNVSSGLVDAWRGSNEAAALRTRPRFSDHGRDHDEDEGGVVGFGDADEGILDFDEIEDMRIRGNLFYKLDRSSKEYEEYKFDFHGRKSARNERDWKGSEEKAKKEVVSMASKKDHLREIKKSEEERRRVSLLGCERSKNPSSWLHEVGGDRTAIVKKDDAREMKKSEEESRRVSLLGCERSKNPSSWPHKVGGDRTAIVEKKQRTRTFNQLTAPYHEPFCLDVFISKGSVRACIIHRATSNVVVVAHSISKDMKFDLSSTKNKNACAAVGKILAQRALADDIHNVVYTPRKGERVEGKLQIVVKSIVDGGVDVKVKLKQKSFKQPKHLLPNTRNLR